MLGELAPITFGRKRTSVSEGNPCKFNFVDSLTFRSPGPGRQCHISCQRKMSHSHWDRTTEI